MYYGIDNNTSTFPTGAKSRDFYIGGIRKKVAANRFFIDISVLKNNLFMT